MRIVELYCGIGGLAAALGPETGTEVVAAVDVNRLALSVYSHNFPHHPVVAAIVESLDSDRWQRWNADLWWMSPPCQPFSRRGHQRDVDDPRTRTFLAVLERIAEIRPPYLALENVPPFRGSRAHDRLLETLEQAGYTTIRETVLCPSELGIPNRRRRFYLVAARGAALGPFSEPRERMAKRPLSNYLDRHPPEGLTVDPQVAQRYAGALDIVDADDPDAITACFTSAYGRSHVRSGSYLATTPAGAIRRFSPAEILRLLGFPNSFECHYSVHPDGPNDLSIGNAWRLAGNSLSIPAVRHVLAAIPALRPTTPVNESGD